MAAKVTPEMVDTMVRMRQKGMTCKVVGEMVGLSKDTVSDYTSRYMEPQHYPGSMVGRGNMMRYQVIGHPRKCHLHKLEWGPKLVFGRRTVRRCPRGCMKGFGAET